MYMISSYSNAHSNYTSIRLSTFLKYNFVNTLSDVNFLLHIYIYIYIYIIYAQLYLLA